MQSMCHMCHLWLYRHIYEVMIVISIQTALSSFPPSYKVHGINTIPSIVTLDFPSLNKRHIGHVAGLKS